MFKKAALAFLNAYFPDQLLSLGTRAYSQEGEDLILSRYFHAEARGFFVDVGAHHPYRFSNTYLLYRRGWRGINIDAMPGSMARFRRYRPRDINIEVGIGSEEGTATYYEFDEPAFNTFDGSLAALRNSPPYKIVAEVKLPIRRLRDVLSEAVPPGQSIDLLTIDVEGRDLDVLQSNDWARFRPRVVLAETRNRFGSKVEADPLEDFLQAQGYSHAARTFNTTFMVDQSE